MNTIVSLDVSWYKWVIDGRTPIVMRYLVCIGLYRMAARY